MVRGLVRLVISAMGLRGGMEKRDGVRILF